MAKQFSIAAALEYERRSGNFGPLTLHGHLRENLGGNDVLVIFYSRRYSSMVQRGKMYRQYRSKIFVNGKGRSGDILS